MMRLPKFQFFAPGSLAEACAILAGEGPDAMILAGGTDLVPNMKRRQQQPRALVSRSRGGARHTDSGCGSGPVVVAPETVQ